MAANFITPKNEESVNNPASKFVSDPNAVDYMAPSDVLAFDTAFNSIAQNIEVNYKSSVERVKYVAGQKGDIEEIDPMISVADNRFSIGGSVTPSASLKEHPFPSEGLDTDVSLPFAVPKTEEVGLKPRIHKRPAYNPLIISKPKRTKANSGERQNIIALPQELGIEIPQRQTEIVEALLDTIIQPQRHIVSAKSTEAAQRRATAIAKKSTVRKVATTLLVEGAATQRQQYIAELKSVPDLTLSKPDAHYGHAEPVSAINEEVVKAQYAAEQVKCTNNTAKLGKQDNSDGNKKKRTLIYGSFAQNTTMSKQLTARAQMTVLDPKSRVEHTFKQKVDALPKIYAEMKPWSLGGNANMFDRRPRHPETLSGNVEVEVKAKTNPIRIEENEQGGKIMVQTVSKYAAYIAGFHGRMMSLKSILEIPGARPNITITPHLSESNLIVVRIEDMDDATITGIIKNQSAHKKAMEAAEKKRLRDLGRRGSKSLSKKTKGGRVMKKKESGA